MTPRSCIIGYGVLHTLVMTGSVIVTSLQEPIWKAGYLFDFPWFIATLWDTYLAFLCFFLWVCFVQKSLLVKIIWAILIACLGNIAMGLFIVYRGVVLPENGTFGDFWSGVTRC